MYEITSTASAPLKAFLYVRSFFVLSPTVILSRKHSPTRDSNAGYTRGDFCLFSPVVVPLSDFVTEGRCCKVSLGVIVDAMDIVLLISPAVTVEAMLVVRVAVAGPLGPGIGNWFPGSSCGPPEILRFGIILPLIVWC